MEQTKIDWTEQFKIRVRNNASLKHEVIKNLLVRSLIDKYKSNLYWIRIYTEFKITDNKICDVYFENCKTKEIICYEIQKSVTEEWIKKTTEAYNNFERYLFKTDWILVRENDFNDNINEIDDKIKELIL